MKEDPAITQFKELWQQQNYSGAINVLVARINELNRQQQRKRGGALITVLALLSAVVISALIIFAVLSSLGDDHKSSNSDSGDTANLTEWSAKSALILSRFSDAVHVADSTARVSLSGPVSEMQAARREYQALEAPVAAEKAKAAVVNAMDQTTEIYIEFMSDASDTTVQSLAEKANSAWNAAVSEYQNLNLAVPSTP